MERARLVAEYWNWLPAFRAVAETEHLPTAASQLCTSPSALSRSVKLLEAAVGVPLFERSGRRILLTEGGRTLLGVVRDAMRLVDDGVEVVRSPTFRGVLTIASAGAATTSYVLPAIERLRAAHPHLRPVLVTHPADEVKGQLLRGDVDVAFQSLPLRDDRLVTERLGTLTAGIYCGPGHPLHGREDVTLEEVLEHDFVAPPPGPMGVAQDGWPESVERRVVLNVDLMRVGCEACLQGALLAVLPDILARARGGGLWRLAVDVVPPAEVFAIRRSAVGDHPRSDHALVEEVSREIVDEVARWAGEAGRSD